MSNDIPGTGKTDPRLCALCGGTYHGHGNNPEPLAEWPARCCDTCNQTKVIPERLARLGK